MMKNLYTLLIAMLISGMISGQWIQQNPNYPDTNVLNDLVFFDHSNGWAVGGYIDTYPMPSTTESIHTGNGGSNWDNIWWLFMGYPAQSICFSDELYGWVCGGQEIMHTNDGGMELDSWELQNINISPPQNLFLIYFIDSLHGWAYSWGADISIHNELFKTADGGNNWESLGSMDDFINDIYFLNETVGYSAGLRFRHTTDGGYTWNSMDINMNASSLDVIDENNIWIAGCDDNEKGIIKSSNDGGLTWNKKLGDTIQLLKDVTFIDSNNGWAIGDSGTILHTSNGGNNWEFQESGTLANLNSVFFVDENYGWICGDSSIILHTNNGGIVGIEYPKREAEDFKIYPNPIQSSITIELPTQPSINTTLSISNTNGQLLITQPVTESQTEIDISHFPVGIYFVKVWNDKDVMVRKVIKQ